MGYVSGFGRSRAGGTVTVPVVRSNVEWSCSLASAVSAVGRSAGSSTSVPLSPVNEMASGREPFWVPRRMSEITPPPNRSDGVARLD